MGTRLGQAFPHPTPAPDSGHTTLCQSPLCFPITCALRSPASQTPHRSAPAQLSYLFSNPHFHLLPLWPHNSSPFSEHPAADTWANLCSFCGPHPSLCQLTNSYSWARPAQMPPHLGDLPRFSLQLPLNNLHPLSPNHVPYLQREHPLVPHSGMHDTVVQNTKCLESQSIRFLCDLW